MTDIEVYGAIFGIFNKKCMQTMRIEKERGEQFSHPEKDIISCSANQTTY